MPENNGFIENNTTLAKAEDLNVLISSIETALANRGVTVDISTFTKDTFIDSSTPAIREMDNAADTLAYETDFLISDAVRGNKVFKEFYNKITLLKNDLESNLGCNGTCTFSCYSTCSEGCTGGCTEGCASSCGEGCSNSCDTGCSTGCDTGCKTSCSGRCGYSCTSSCGSGCANGCSDKCEACSGTCETACGGGCSTDCRGACGGSCYGWGIAACLGVAGVHLAFCPGVGGCSLQCKGCGGECTGACHTGCTGHCGNTCSGCSTSCGSGCRSGCTGCANLCSGSCDATCGSGCSTNCSTSCLTECVSGCSNGCAGGCYQECSKSCRTNCDNTCVNGAEFERSDLHMQIIYCDNCSTSCLGGCSDSCYDTCSDGCYTTCLGSCDTTCQVQCANDCETACQDGCLNTCFDGCDDTCTTSCDNTCLDECVTTCRDSCIGTCSVGCEDTCADTCLDTCMTECVNTCMTECVTQCVINCADTCFDTSGWGSLGPWPPLRNNVPITITKNSLENNILNFTVNEEIDFPLSSYLGFYVYYDNVNYGEEVVADSSNKATDEGSKLQMIQISNATDPITGNLDITKEEGKDFFVFQIIYDSCLAMTEPNSYKNPYNYYISPLYYFDESGNLMEVDDTRIIWGSIVTPTLSLSRSGSTVRGTIGNTQEGVTYVYKVGSAPTSVDDGTQISGTTFSFSNSSSLTVYVKGFRTGYHDSEVVSASVGSYNPTPSLSSPQVSVEWLEGLNQAYIDISNWSDSNTYQIVLTESGGNTSFIWGSSTHQRTINMNRNHFPLTWDDMSQNLSFYVRASRSGYLSSTSSTQSHTGSYKTGMTGADLGLTISRSGLSTSLYGDNIAINAYVVISPSASSSTTISSLGVKIYWTIDGSTPTMINSYSSFNADSSPSYYVNTGINKNSIPAGSTIKIRAYANGVKVSSTVTLGQID